jgi:LysR family transcriptional activator of glutamate synthase operon
MDIDYLKDFVVLADTGNFLEAADILYSTQSTLSKHIKSLEMELGVLLFDRTTRKVSISKFGQVFLPYARQMVELQDKYTHILQSSRETDQEVLNLGSIYGLAQYKITDVLIGFKKSRPQSTLNVFQQSSRDLAEMLRQKKCELAFIRDIENEEDEFVQIPFATDTIAAALPINHPLAKQKTIPLRMLAEENFLLAVPKTNPYNLSIKACELSGFEPRVTYTDSEIENLVDFAGNGMGVALVLKKLALFLSNPKIAIVDITPGVLSRIDLCHLKGVTLSEAAKSFVQCAQEQSASMGLLNRQETLTLQMPYGDGNLEDR